MRKFLFLIVIFLIFHFQMNSIGIIPNDSKPNIPVLPIFIDTVSINQYDDMGLKKGYWYEEAYGYISYANYNKGKKNGVAIVFLSTEEGSGTFTMFMVSVYEMGHLRGPLFLFNQNGRIGLYIVSLEDYPDDYFKFKGYTYEYNDDGSLKCEGWAIYDETCQIYDIKIGRWKIYNTDGSFYEKDYDE